MGRKILNKISLKNSLIILGWLAFFVSFNITNQVVLIILLTIVRILP